MTKTLPYTENHALRDGRLAICGLAVFIAGFALVWDFFFPFPQVGIVAIKNNNVQLQT